MEGKLTVYFEDPFWVGVYERQDETGYSVARVVFGSEPTDVVLYQFILQHYDEFHFGRSLPTGSIEKKEKNYKRIQREARKVMQETGVGTKAQQAMKLSLTETKQERREISSAEQKRDAEQRFQERQEKKKEKRRGR